METQSLIQRYMIGDITETEVRELDRLLAENPELRREFLLAAATDTQLREVAFQNSAKPEHIESTNRPNRRGAMTTLAGIAAAVVAVIVIGSQYIGNDFVAVLESSENAAWESSLPTTPGSGLTPGLMKLKSGVATIRFDSGAEVLLEAPASLELVSSMRGKLFTGAAVINVPESAIGFVVETPDGYVVDYGTRFAVQVDQRQQRSNFDLIEGEIAVHHPDSGEEIRLTDAGTAATISNQSIAVVDVNRREETAAASSPSVVRIGTNGRTGSAMKRNHKRHKYIKPEFLSVKHTDSGTWDHRSFFAFDLANIRIDQIVSARLRLNLVPSTRGTRSRLPKINRFGIYGLTNQAKANWQADVLWDESPGPNDGVLLGTFEIPRSQQRGSFGIDDERLLEFLQNQNNSIVTFILVRETTQIEGIGPGLTHLFASHSHPEAVGPMLELTKSVPPAL